MYTAMGQELRRLRLKADLKQKEVAELLGYSSPQFISNWERGISSPPVKTLKQLAGIYNTNPDKLFQSLRNAVVEQMKTEFESSVG